MSNQLAYVATMLSVVGILLFLKREVDSSSGKLGPRRGGPQTALAEDPFRNTQAVSQQDCKRELQPLHLQLGSVKTAKKGVDYVFTTAVGYTPYQTRFPEDLSKTQPGSAHSGVGGARPGMGRPYLCPFTADMERVCSAA